MKQVAVAALLLLCLSACAPDESTRVTARDYDGRYWLSIQKTGTHNRHWIAVTRMQYVDCPVRSAYPACFNPAT